MIAILLLLAAPDVLDVDPVHGPYFQIRDAVESAADGDVVRVAEGTYLHFGLFDRSVRVVPRVAGAAVVVAGSVRVQGLDAGSEVVLSGLAIQAADGGDPALVVAGCVGSVRVEDCEVRGGTSVGARVDASADVAFVGSSIRGGCRPAWLDGCEGLGGVVLTDSNVTLWDTECAGEGSSSYGYTGSVGVLAEGSDVFLHGGRALGGSGGPERSSTWSGCQFEAGDGGAAFSARDSRVRVRDAELVPGAPGGSWMCAPASPGAPYVDLGGSTRTDHAGDALTFDLDAPWVSGLAPVTLTATGGTGETVLLLVGPSAGRVPMPGYVGDLHVSGTAGSVRRALLGVAPVQRKIVAPDASTLGSIQWTLQTVHQRAGGEVVFGPARSFTVLDR